jgi:general L-amino acid transport system permease protein
LETTGQLFLCHGGDSAADCTRPGDFGGRQPAAVGVPELTGFNFTGGWVLIPELMA